MSDYKTCIRLGHDWTLHLGIEEFDVVEVSLECKRCMAISDSATLDIRTYDGRYIEWVLQD